MRFVHFALGQFDPNKELLELKKRDDRAEKRMTNDRKSVTNIEHAHHNKNVLRRNPKRFNRTNTKKYNFMKKKDSENDKFK